MLAAHKFSGDNNYRSVGYITHITNIADQTVREIIHDANVGKLACRVKSFSSFWPSQLNRKDSSRLLESLGAWSDVNFVGPARARLLGKSDIGFGQFIWFKTFFAGNTKPLCRWPPDDTIDYHMGYMDA